MENMSCNVFRENKILAKISKLTVSKLQETKRSVVQSASLLAVLVDKPIQAADRRNSEM